jgi:hypothetical protein
LARMLFLLLALNLMVASALWATASYRSVSLWRPSKTWGVCRPLVQAADWAADWVERRESGMVRVAMAYRLCSPPKSLDGLMRTRSVFR